MSLSISVLLAAVLGATHIYSDHVADWQRHNRTRLLSFTAGISVAYIFLELFPATVSGLGGFLSEMVFFSVLLGFVLVHSIEKYTLQHEDPPEVTRERLSEIHSISFFLYHLVTGALLLRFLSIGLEEGLLFFFPIFFHSLGGSASLENVHYGVKENKLIHLGLSVSTLLGVLIGAFLALPEMVYRIALGFVIGVILFIVVRDYIPPGKEGDLPFFLQGVFFYGILILALMFV